MKDLILKICEQCRYKHNSNATFPCVDCSSRDRWELAETITANSKDIEALQQQLEQYDQDRTAAQQLWGEECEECIKLQQENEQLRGQMVQAARGSVWIIDLAAENVRLQQENEQLQAQNGAMRVALKHARETLITLNTLGGLGFDKHRWIDEALAAIDKAVGK